MTKIHGTKRTDPRRTRVGEKKKAQRKRGQGGNSAQKREELGGDNLRRGVWRSLEKTPKEDENNANAFKKR